MVQKSKNLCRTCKELPPSTFTLLPADLTKHDNAFLATKSKDGNCLRTEQLYLEYLSNMMHPNSLLARLFAAPVNPGQVIWIGVRPARREQVLVQTSVMAVAGQGLLGDRYRSASNGPRQVTLIQTEHLMAIASFLQREAIDPGLLRRNIVVRGINLLALKDRQFQIGHAVLEYTGECHPCSRMEENLGPGGYNAVRGHGGITARVLVGGEIAVGDSVCRIERDAEARLE